MSDYTRVDSHEHLHFVTGRLAQHAVREVVGRIASEVGFEFSIGVMPITVAALMTGKWLLRHLQVPPQATRVIVPGYLQPDLEWIRQHVSTPVECGPRDIRDLTSFFGKNRDSREGYGDHRIEIIAEINHAPRLSRRDIMEQASKLRADGADVIDIGCDPGRVWSEVGDVVRALRDEGVRVSIDSFDVTEVEMACRAGAELVLSVNASNRECAVDWGVEVVVVPDVTSEEKNFLETINFLVARGVRVRVDPILEPIGCGFTASLRRYIDCRQQFPSLPMMMGIGNLTELTDVDSAGINVLLLGICEELGIQSVLTTEVINWARTSVRECALARALVHYACQQRIPPKHLEENLVLLRDPKLLSYPDSMFGELASSIRDHNIRLFAQGDEIHLVTAGLHLHSSDPFELMQRLLASDQGARIDSSHAFYLGYETSKALTAITLGKNYEQDEALKWGFLTRQEKKHRG